MNPSPSINSTFARRAPLLEEKLRRLGARLCWTEGTRRLAFMVTVILAVTGVAMLMDWLFELSLGIRYLSFGVQCILIVVMFGWLVIGVVSRNRRAADDLALMVERAEPEFRGRLISAVQFANGQGAVPQAESDELVESLIRETERVARGHAFGSAIDYRPWRKALVACGIVLTASLVIWFASGAVIRVLLERQFFAETPIPRQTQISAIEFPQRVGVGDSIEILVRATGRLPERGSLSIRYASGMRQDLDLLPVGSNADTYRATIEAVAESFTWKGRLNDARLTRQSVTAVHRPVVTGVSLTQFYPDFMNLQPSAHQPGDFHLFPGARAEIDILTNHPIASGTLSLLGLDKALALAPATGTPGDPLKATIEVPKADLKGFSIQLRDREGMEARDQVAFRISLATDSPPTIQLVEPRRAEETATPEAALLLGWKASDRFGIREFVLCRQLDGDETVHREVISISGETDPRDLSMEHVMNFAEVSPRLQIGSKLKLWVEAVDVNPATPAGVSRPLQVSIITPEEKRRQLLGRVADALGRLESVATEQETLNGKLNEVIRQK